MVGLSHGAGGVLEAAAYAPERVAAAALVVPAGFGTAPSLSLVRVVVPSLAHRLTGSRWLLDRALAGLFTEAPGDVPAVSRDTIGLALRTGDLGARFPGPEMPDALAGFAAPALVVTAEHDPFFPPARTVDRAERWLPGSVESVVLDGERHFLSPGAPRAVTARIDAFLSAAVSGTSPDEPDGSL
jgi:pimeloyl-ACP methyl ester carboxylesterase